MTAARPRALETQPHDDALRDLPALRAALDDARRHAPGSNSAGTPVPVVVDDDDMAFLLFHDKSPMGHIVPCMGQFYHTRVPNYRES